VLRTKTGISKVYFVEFPKEVQERFHYDAGKPNAYSAVQSAKVEALRKQQEGSPSTATGSQASADLMKPADVTVSTVQIEIAKIPVIFHR
jgi:hypothetical protein